MRLHRFWLWRFGNSKFKPCFKVESWLAPANVDAVHQLTEIFLSKRQLQMHARANTPNQNISGPPFVMKRYGVQINHIRKTTPLLRALEIYSVRTGGGAYNRSGLFDGILIKDNHLAVARRLGLSLPEVVARCRLDMPHTIKIGLEITSLAELNDGIQAQPDYLVLDNMTLNEIIEAVKRTDGRIPIDVTGSVNISNLENIAATGINMVGVGAITHSAPSLDMSLEIEPD